MPILFAAWFFVLGGSAKAADVIWDNSQVRVVSRFEVNSWDRLIIRPGTIIKMKAGGSIVSYGNIEAIGDAEHPVIFTSIKDDSVGGDTNGDGNATAPAMGDWSNFLIQGEGKHVIFDYTQIHYAGGSSDKRPASFISVSNYGEPGVILKEINITHSSIVNNFGGVGFYGDAIFKISQSNFYNEANCPLPPDWNPLYLRCDQLSISKAGGTKIEAPYVYWGHKDGPTTLEDYLTGIKKGTKVYYNANFIPFLIEPWPSDLIGPIQKELGPVILVPGIMGSWNISGRWQLDPILHTYDNLMEALIAAGYKEDSLSEDRPTLFTFPYDWRVDNNITANLLKEKIQLVKEITGRDKVDIIAHSLGGLVTRSYIQGDDYQNDIDQAIFLGAPHRGAVESYLKYEGAYFQGIFGAIQKYLFRTEAALNGYLDLTDYIRARVLTVEQLLPTFDYLKDKQADNSWLLRAYPLNYPQNIYLENLNNIEAINLLKQRVRIINIVSDLGDSSTLNYLKVIADPDATDNKWQNGYPENLNQNLDSLEMGAGDGTVPLSSAASLNGVEVIETNNSDHTNLPTIMQKEIIKALTGQTPADYYNSKITSTIKRWFFFRVYSPVDIAVVAPDGKKVGKDFLTNTAVNEIPDAFYSGFDGQAEFVLIPNPLDGEYRVEVQGVADGGEYTVANSLIDNGQETSREYSGDIASAQQRDFNITYEAAEENPLSDLEPEDTAPPVVIINKPAEADKYLHSDDLIIDYAATDDFSGLATTTIMIDGQPLATTTVDLFDYSLGQHNLVIAALDKAGNQAEARVNFEIIVSIDSVISDIEEIYDRGWLKDRIYYALLKDAFKLLKTEAKYFEREQELTERLIWKTRDDRLLTNEQKQKLIEQYDKKLAELKKNKAKAIDRNLDAIVKLLERAKKQDQLNQLGYDIILSDVNYLRVNL